MSLESTVSGWFLVTKEGHMDPGCYEKLHVFSRLGRLLSVSTSCPLLLFH